MKVCRKCGKSGEDELFVNRANICKECNNLYLKQYREMHPDPAANYDPDVVKTCSVCGFTGKAISFRKGRNVCKKCHSKRCKNYQKKNAEYLSNYRKNKYAAHREDLVELQRQYRKTHKSTIAVRSKNKYMSDPSYKLAINKKYAATPKGKIAWGRKRHLRRRKLGYEPINSWFENADCHHLRVTPDLSAKDNSLALYIPQRLHRSIQHNGETGSGMREINIKALQWYIQVTPEGSRDSRAEEMLGSYLTSMPCVAEVTVSEVWEK